ncbi:ABC transporter permease [candidate division KSB1 bacterium]
MLINYIKTTIRNIQKQKGYSFINIFSLAIGIAFCILTFLYISHEWGYDSFHEHADRIYRVYYEGKTPDGDLRTRSDLPLVTARLIESEFPEVVRSVRLMAARGNEYENRIVRISSPDRSFNEQFLLADSDFFNMFSFLLISGIRETPLQEKYSVVISSQAAEKYFGSNDPIGMLMTVHSNVHERNEIFTVTGVVSIPDNSSIKFDFLFPFDNLDFFFAVDETEPYGLCNTYIQLSEKTEPDLFEQKLSTFAGSIFPSMPESDALAIRLQNFTDIHFGREVSHYILHGLEPPSTFVYSYILAGISLLVLLVACINFINLSMGRAATRHKEIGVRKLAGASQKHLVYQFFGETVLLSFFSVCLGIVMAELLLPVFNSLTGSHSAIMYNELNIVIMLTGLTLFVSIIAGAYPTVLLSVLQPLDIIRGRLKMGGANVFSRSLVVIQFTLSIFLIISAAIMLRQLYFVSTMDKGFRDDGLIIVHTDELPETAGLMEVRKQEFLAHEDIIGVTRSRYPVVQDYLSTGKPATAPGGAQINVQLYYADYDFIETLGLQLADGRDFSREMGTDSRGAMIVNETLVRTLGWNSPVGQTMQFNDTTALLQQNTGGIGKVIGIVKDFHFQSFYKKVLPSAIVLNSTMGSEAREFLVRINPGAETAALEHIKKVWQETAPDYVFRYAFLTESMNAHYDRDERWGRIVLYSALFAVIIACLGALGLTVLSVNKRTKEIGIRKTYGASEQNVVILLIKEFSLLIGIANIIAWPAAYLVQRSWLDNFAYRAAIGPGTYLIAGLFALTLMVITVSIQAFKAARTNPVDSLRYE